jgi:glycosyltransferase involved in cell wall biosynthesis
MAAQGTMARAQGDFPMKRFHLLHLFNCFQIGGVERQHFLLVKGLQHHFRQTCWAYHPGQLELELRELGVTTICGDITRIGPAIGKGVFEAVVMRTHRYFRDFMKIFSQVSTPLIYIKDYLRWFEGNDTFIDVEFDHVIHDRAQKIFYCGPSLYEGVKTLKIKRSGTEMLPNSLDMNGFPLQPRSAARNGRIRIGILANMVRVKNQLAAIDCLRPLLLDERVLLVLGGDDHDAAYARCLKKAAAGLPVRFTGYVQDVPGFMAGVDVLLLTSLQEGWPVVLMEAMACGVPVIAPEIGDIPELLLYGRAGLLYPSGDYHAVLKHLATLQNPEAYGAYSRIGIERVRAFDIRHNIARFVRTMEAFSSPAEGASA